MWVINYYDGVSFETSEIVTIITHLAGQTYVLAWLQMELCRAANIFAAR